MKELHNKTTKQLADMIEVVVRRFFAAKMMHQLRENDSLFENDYNHDSPYDSYLASVEFAYESLTEQEQNLINNEFFYQNYSNWWKTIYSKSSFYRRRKEAMIKFLGVLYHD